jgi:hypothetical protein
MRGRAGADAAVAGRNCDMGGTGSNAFQVWGQGGAGGNERRRSVTERTGSGAGT